MAELHPAVDALARFIEESGEEEVEDAFEYALTHLDPGQRDALAAFLTPERPAAPDDREDTLRLLREPLDMGRVKKKPGSNADYLAEHDVVRTANRIFGFGNWGTTVVWHELIGAHNIKNSKGELGWQIGYRCCVRLTVAGCQPVDGVGYGDAFEKQWSGVVTAHELACKEAESDAIKRAFKKYGDQFGLILYAKEHEREAVAAQAAADAETADLTPEDRERAAARARFERPKSWPALADDFQMWAAQPLAPWMAEIVPARFPGKAKTTELTPEQQKELFNGVVEVALDCAVDGPGPDGLPPLSDEKIQAFVYAHLGVAVKAPAPVADPVAAA